MTTPRLAYRRRVGSALFVGASLTVAGSIAVAVALSTSDVSMNLFRYPLTHGASVGLSIFAAGTHAVILFGVVWLLRSGTLGQSRAVRTALQSVVVRDSASVRLRMAVEDARRSRNSATWPTIVDTGFAVASVAAVLGVLVAGVAFARQGWPRSWRQYAPLICGLLSLVVIPLQFISAIWLGVALYGVGYGLLGLARFRDPVLRSRVWTHPA